MQAPDGLHRVVAPDTGKIAAAVVTGAAAEYGVHENQQRNEFVAEYKKHSQQRKSRSGAPRERGVLGLPYADRRREATFQLA
ncbi:hypothetical protein GCM10027048_31150 [Hymenobacter coalescens]